MHVAPRVMPLMMSQHVPEAGRAMNPALCWRVGSEVHQLVAEEVKVSESEEREGNVNRVQRQRSSE